MTRDTGVNEIFSARSHAACILRFEAALARAEAAAGIVPSDDAKAIEDACRVERLDMDAVGRDAMRAGTVVVPILEQLRARLPESARAYVHLAATSQDAIDTAFVAEGFRAPAHLRAVPVGRAGVLDAGPVRSS